MIDYAKLGLTPEQVEASRKNVNVPDDWEVVLCDAACGDIVWHQPGVQEALKQQGKPFVMVCSEECLRRVSNGLL